MGVTDIGVDKRTGVAERPVLDAVTPLNTAKRGKDSRCGKSADRVVDVLLLFTEIRTSGAEPRVRRNRRLRGRFSFTVNLVVDIYLDLVRDHHLLLGRA